MNVSSTEIQNNFGKYLMLAAREEIVVTRNGAPIAKLVGWRDEKEVPRDAPNSVHESAGPYRSAGRSATFEEFIKLTDSSDDRYEYIDGEIYMLASPRMEHQFTLGELFVEFHRWSKGSGCESFMAPFDIRLDRATDKPNRVQPDLLIICDMEAHLDDQGNYRGIPALVVEILSDGTRSKDLVKKLDLYMSCGVKEYWIVDPSAKDILIYQFEGGDIGRKAVFKQGEAAASFVFEGLQVQVDSLFRR